MADVRLGVFPFDPLISPLFLFSLSQQIPPPEQTGKPPSYNLIIFKIGRAVALCHYRHHYNINNFIVL